MLEELIVEHLKEINLNLDPETIELVQNYVIYKIGIINDIELEYQVYAGLAIISEISKLPTIGHFVQSKNGIKIENVMSHLDKLSKERFLDTLNRQLEKDKNAPQYLKKKVEDIRYSYRFYKKYQTTFQQLFELKVQSHLKEQFSAFFWVIFLYIKNTHIETENITESKHLLILLFRMIFERFLSNAQFAEIFFIMQQNIGSIPQISTQKYAYYLGLVQQKINPFYAQRFSQSKANFSKMLSSYTIIQRMVDDLSNQYIKDQSGLRYYNQIDEMSYLQLKKNLTPQVFRKSLFVEEPQPIGKLIFSDEFSDEEPQERISEEIDEEIRQNPVKKPIIEDEDGRPTPKPTLIVDQPNQTPRLGCIKTDQILSSQLDEQNDGVTPISKKVHNEGWMNKKIGFVTHKEIKSFLDFFGTADKSESVIVEEPSTLQTFESAIKKNIFQMIKDFTPKCQNYEERFSKILAFIVANYGQLKKLSPNFFNVDDSFPKKKLQIIGISTFSCQIFNYINNSVSYAFKQHCEAFGTDIKTAFQTLQLFNSAFSNTMPVDLKDYLRKSIKRFFVDDIWEKGQGYKILCQTSTQSEFASIRLSIADQSDKRVKQISYQAKIDPKIIKKTQNMIKFILQNKPYLLKNNNIDQIILCCLMSCLSINEKQQNQTLQYLFCQYNSNIQFSFNSNQSGLKDQFGNEMKIVDYYNEVFLSEIQDMLEEKQDELDEFLLTPVRITKRYSGSSIETNIQKKKQLPGAFMFNPEKLSARKQNFRRKVIKMNLEMKEEKQEDQEDVPSPNFGMNRKITFAKQNSQSSNK